MKIFPVSDMHLEYHHQSLPPYRGLADVVVCAGDMHTTVGTAGGLPGRTRTKD